MIYEIRLLIMTWLLDWALDIAPESKHKTALAYYLKQYYEAAMMLDGMVKGVRK